MLGFSTKEGSTEKKEGWEFNGEHPAATLLDNMITWKTS